MLVGARIHRRLTMLVAGVMTIATMTLGVALPAGAALTSVTLSPSSGSGVSVGATITATVSGTASDSLSYQWYSCSSPVSGGTSTPACTTETVAGSSGTVAIGSGGTASLTYVAQPSDFQTYLTVYVDDTTATAAIYPASTSNVTEAVPSASSPTLSTSTASPVLGTAVSATNAFSMSGLSSSSSLAAFTQNGITAYNATGVSYQWYGCASSVTVSAATTTSPGCGAISGATTSTYTPTTSDVSTYKLEVSETVTNAVGSVPIYSPTTNVVSGSAPTLTTAPTVTLSSFSIALASFGTWGGSPSPTSYSVTWYRCLSQLSSATTTLPTTCGAGNSSGSPTQVASYPNVTTTAAATYTLTSSDVGTYLFAAVSAYNGFTSTTTSYTASSAAVAQKPPVLLSTLSITGSGVPGTSLSVSTGTWTGLPTPTFGYAWYECTSNVTSGSVSGGAGTIPSAFSGCTSVATAQSLTVPNNVSSYLIPVVTAKTTYSSTSDYAQAWPTGIQITAAQTPTVSPTATPGNNASFSASASVSGGTSGLTYAYQYAWYGCNGPVTGAATTSSSSVFVTPSTSSGSCSQVDTGPSYTVTSLTPFTGGGLVLEALASVSGVGSWYAYTSATSISNTSPSISAVAIAATPTGSALSSVNDSVTVYANPTVTSMPASTLSYNWFVCTSAGSAGATRSASGCTSSLATGSSYAPNLTTTQLNSGTTYYLVAEVYVGATTYYSTGLAVTSMAPALVTYPSVPSTASTATNLVATASTWLGYPAPTLTYQWYVCTNAVTTTSLSVPAGCGAIAGASGVNDLTYLPSGSYVGKYFLIGVTASNGLVIAGASTDKTAFSASTTTALVSSLAITSLAISGTATVGSTVTAIPVVANQGNAYTSAYQWYECTTSVPTGTSVPANCYSIPGATAVTFVPTSNQANYYLTVFDTVSGAGTTASALAASTGLVTTSVPGSPTSVTAVAGVGQATVSWLAPTTGLAVTSYRVTASNGSFCTATTTSCVVTGLLYGTSYTFTVTASNAYGTSPASLLSNAIMPSESYPAAPTGVTAVPGNQSATVSWSAAVNNGALVSAYVVTAFPGGMTCSTSLTTCVVSGLTNGTAYTFTVVARNVVGAGPASYASDPVTPKVAAAPVPINVVVKRGSGTITVTWAAGIANGATVSGYVVSATGGGVTRTCTTTGTTCVVRGLVNGVAYHVSVIAKSASGNGVTTVAAAVVPVGRPSAPVIFATFGGAGVVIVHFRAPTQTGGVRIAYYQYLINGRWTVQTLKGKLFAVIRGLLRHHAYIVRVRAVSAGGPSPASMWVRVITR